MAQVVARVSNWLRLNRVGGCSGRYLLAAIGISLALTACTGRRSDRIALPEGGEALLTKAETLKVNLTSEPPTLDWSKATDVSSSKVINNIMEGLVAYDLQSEELALRPALAEKWSSDAAARVWVFELRADLKWHDGVEFTGQQVVDGFQRLLAKDTGSEYAYFLFGIKNAKAFNQGQVGWDKVGVKLLAPRKLQVTLEAPMSYFPHLLAHTSTFPVRLDLIQKHGAKWTEAGNMVGLGPYRLRAWRHDQDLLLEKHDAYWGSPKPEIRYVHFLMVNEASTALNLFDSGTLDVVDQIPITERKRRRAQKEYRRVGMLQSLYYGFNTQIEPTNNPKLRRAIAHAIDREKIVKILDGGEVPLTGWVPPGMFGYFSDVGLEPNLEKARSYLAEAGYGEGKKPLPKLELHFNTNEVHQSVAEAVQAQLRENLGLEVELKSAEWKSYLDQLKVKPPHVFRFGWQADYPDPDNFMNLMTSYSDNNRTRWKNAAYDALIKRGASETDREKRREIYREASRLLLEEGVAAVPLYANVSHMLIHQRVENYPANALSRFEFKGTRLK